MVGVSVPDRKAQCREIDRRRQFRSDREAPIAWIRDGTSWTTDIKPESRPRIRLHEGGVRRLLHQRGRQPVRQDSSPRPTSYGELLERVRLAERLLSNGRRTGRVA